jgi:hypothetical protein
VTDIHCTLTGSQRFASFVAREQELALDAARRELLQSAKAARHSDRCGAQEIALRIARRRGEEEGDTLFVPERRRSRRPPSAIRAERALARSNQILTGVDCTLTGSPRCASFVAREREPGLHAAQVASSCSRRRLPVIVTGVVHRRSRYGSRAAVVRRREGTRFSSRSDDEVGGHQARSARSER